MEEKKVKILRLPAYVEDRFLVIEHDLKSMHMATDTRIYETRESLSVLADKINYLLKLNIEVEKRLTLLEHDKPGFLGKIKNWFC